MNLVFQDEEEQLFDAHARRSRSRFASSCSRAAHATKAFAREHTAATAVGGAAAAALVVVAARRPGSARWLRPTLRLAAARLTRDVLAAELGPGPEQLPTSLPEG